MILKIFHHFGNDFGLGDTIKSFDGIAIDDESWRASDLYACLVAADFKRTFPAPGNALREGFMIIGKADFEPWREQALAKFAPPGLVPEEEVGEYGIAIEDFVPHVNHTVHVCWPNAQGRTTAKLRRETLSLDWMMGAPWSDSAVTAQLSALCANMDTKRSRQKTEA